MSELYTKHALKYAEAVKDNVYNAMFERPSTLALLDEVSGSDVLDIGCGSGEYAQWLIEHSAAKVTCLDVSQQMVDIVTERFANKVSAYQQDIALGLPKERDDSADLVICPLVLHYIADLTPVFAEIHRVLKQGGYLVFSTHHPFADIECSKTGNYFEREFIEDEWHTIGQPVAVSFYRRSLTELCQAVSSAGLVIEAITEGCVDPQIQQVAPETHEYLSKNPNFIFMKCRKR